MSSRKFDFIAIIFSIFSRPLESPQDFLITDPNQKVKLVVSFDMGWSHRANGYNFDSLSGHCAILGYYTGKPLDFVQYCRKCNVCDNDAKNGTKTAHDCRLNYWGSAKGQLAQESTGAVDLVARSAILKEGNSEVGVFIGDNDAGCMSELLKNGCYNVIEQSDMNHTAKGVKNALYEIKKNNFQDPQKELNGDSIGFIKKCFTYAVKQNLGDVEKLKQCLRKFPYHAFGQHDNCGAWCKANEDKENHTRTVHFVNDALFTALKTLFDKLAENAQKFIMAASSQGNESLNNTATSKAPKRICYSKSESANFRFAATIAQKIDGEQYIMNVLDEMGISYDSSLSQHFSTRDTIHLKRKVLVNTQEFKKRCIQANCDKAQLRYRTEQYEGQTYSSNMTLFDNPPTFQNCISEDDDCGQLENADVAVVFFDLETGGFDVRRHDILQISAKYSKFAFNTYLTPTSPIDQKASEIHGLTSVNKKLYKHGKEVFTLNMENALNQFLDFFKQLCNEKVYFISS